MNFKRHSEGFLQFRAFPHIATMRLALAVWILLTMIGKAQNGAVLATIGKARGAEIYSDLPTASASGSSAFIKSAKRDGFSCCGPSERAISGRGCTSISKPYAHPPIPANANGATHSSTPEPWT